MTRFDDNPNGQTIAGFRNAAPWLLEVAACFQPGDAELIGEWLYQLEEEYGSDGESPNQPITRMLARLQKAAAIVEELE